MKRFSKRFIGLLAITSSVCTNFCADFNLSRVVVFTPNSTSNILYSQKSSLFNGNPDFKLYLIQILGARLRYVSCESENMAQDIGTVRVISRSNYSFRNGRDLEWFTKSIMTELAIEYQSWCINWWTSFNHSHPGCGIGMNSAGPYVDASCGTFLEGLAKVKEFYIGLKQASISEQEVQARISYAAQQISNQIIGIDSAIKTYQISTTIPGAILNPFPIPGSFFLKEHFNLFSLEDASLFLEDWKVSPLEVICVSNHTSPQTDFLNAIHELVNIISAPSFDSIRHVGYSGFHFSPNFEFDCLCNGTPSTAASIPLLAINLGMVSPESLVAGSILAKNFNSLADGVMVYDSSWTIRGGCVIFNVMINDKDSPANINNISRKNALLFAVNSVRSGCCQPSILETNLAKGGSWEMHRTEDPSKVTFEDGSRFLEPTHIMSNITNWLSEAFEGEFAFEDLNNMNAEILADTTGEVLKAFSEKVENNILYSLGVSNSRHFLLNFIPTGS